MASRQLLRRGASFIKRHLDRSAAEAVRYIRGVQVIGDLAAWPGQELVETYTEGEMVLVATQRTWRVDPSLLNFGDGPVDPQRGDRIEWDNGGRTEVYEVLPALNEKLHLPGDLFGNWIRISSKLVEVRSIG